MYKEHRAGGATAVVRWDADRACLALAGEFDMDTAPIVWEALGDIPATVPDVLVDCRAIGFADCSLLRPLVAARRTRAVTLAGPLPLPLDTLLAATATRGLFPLAQTAAPADHGPGNTPCRLEQVPTAAYFPPPPLIRSPCATED
ncbi:STAS domain-containing protein [Streptomyces subrutilus]|uniref:STAS domain-containing protein n=1 Tax=Streptomyces subrutilus TaxID=36818 RepID=UPI00340A8E3E